MKYEDALRILSEAASLAAMPKHAHLQVEQAYKVLDDLIKEKRQKEKAEIGEAK
jgi:hypothetical protein